MKAHVKFLALFIEQKNGKDFVVDDLAHQFGDAAQGSLEIERGIDDVRHFEQERFHFIGDVAGWRGGRRLHRFHDSSRELKLSDSKYDLK